MRLGDLERLCYELERFYNGYTGELRKVASEALDLVCMFPEIDPEDLRPKGKWIGIEYDGYADGNPVYDLWECSNCGNEENGEDVPEQNPFCRCCGAKMEG